MEEDEVEYNKYHSFNPIRSFSFKDEALFITRKETGSITLEV